MCWSILDEQRRAILPRLAICRDEGFYLAGGTALALQIGHRDSVDFDFFTAQVIDTARLFDVLQAAFQAMPLVKVQDERNSLTVIADGAIKMSFMRYPYLLLRPLVRSEHLDLADITDIGCMKLSVITGRGTLKDYVDLYFILRRITLNELLILCAQKLPQLDRALVLKALVFFDDLDPEPIRYVKDHAVPFDEVKKLLRAQAKKAY